MTQWRAGSDPYAVSDNQEVDEGPAPGWQLKPIPERYAGVNIPYRGTETHGVDPLFVVEPHPDEVEGGMVPIIMPSDEPPRPVQDVRIVKEGPKEIIEWRAYQGTCGGSANILVGRMDSRISFRLKNLSADKRLIVGGDNNLSRFMGWPVAPDAEFTVDADTEVYGISEDGTDIPYSVVIVYAVQVK